MTERSKRRAAEMAVIDAATAMWRKGPHWQAPNYPLPAELWGSLLSGHMMSLGRAVMALENLGVPDLEPARANIDAPQTAHDAAAWMRPRVKRTAGKVFQVILTATYGGTGLTVDAIEQRVGGTHQGLSPRVTELRNAGLIVDSGKRRETRSGHKAIVWVASEIGKQGAKEIEEWAWM